MTSHPFKEKHFLPLGAQVMTPGLTSASLSHGDNRPGSSFGFLLPNFFLPLSLLPPCCAGPHPSRSNGLLATGLVSSTLAPRGISLRDISDHTGLIPSTFGGWPGPGGQVLSLAWTLRDLPRGCPHARGGAQGPRSPSQCLLFPPVPGTPSHLQYLSLVRVLLPIFGGASHPLLSREPLPGLSVVDLRPPRLVPFTTVCLVEFF